jgi:hypothetical protein
MLNRCFRAWVIPWARGEGPFRYLASNVEAHTELAMSQTEGVLFACSQAVALPFEKWTLDFAWDTQKIPIHLIKGQLLCLGKQSFEFHHLGFLSGLRIYVPFRQFLISEHAFSGWWIQRWESQCLELRNPRRLWYSGNKRLDWQANRTNAKIQYGGRRGVNLCIPIPDYVGSRALKAFFRPSPLSSPASRNEWLRHEIA